MIQEGKYLQCPLTAAMHILGGKWKVVILGHLFTGRKRFGELKELMGGVTKKILAEQLRELEKDGLIFREEFSANPPRVEYELTHLGQSLEPVLKHLCIWGNSLLSRDLS